MFPQRPSASDSIAVGAAASAFSASPSETEGIGGRLAPGDVVDGSVTRPP
jgi:hypothetical protein